MAFLWPRNRDDNGKVRVKAGDHALNQRSWIEKVFMKRECNKFIASARDATRCQCGRGEAWHTNIYDTGFLTSDSDERWHPYKHTEARPTDAYGTVEFQGAPHPSKAQYLRLSSLDTKPEHVLQILQKQWSLELPKLLITVHGGISNFDLQPKLKRVFRKGLLKAAKTTGAWIITAGTNTGVTKHVGDAISDRTTKAKNKVVAIGVAPWGVVENKDDLIGQDVVVPYHCVSSPKNNYAVLNSNHSYFLLVDNGTVGKYGGEILFRKKLEKYISQQRICIRSGMKGRGVPVICVVLEGGTNTIRSVLDYVTDNPPIPVVVCDGSGRAADLLAFAHKFTNDDGTMAESLRDQLLLTIQKTFLYNEEQAEKFFIELMLCVKRKELITVFRMVEGAQDIDMAVLTALLKGTNANAPDQLSLALTWDRVDIARSHIFVYGQEWPDGSLEEAMMDALINDRVDFVKLLLENGVSMHTFLTIARLEELYNTRMGPSSTLRYLVRDVRKHVPSTYRYTLPDIGLVLQHLMGGAFRATYCRRRFRQKYNAIRQNGTSLANLITSIPTLVNTKTAEELFPYPFHDLMIWAVLMKRQKMAMFMWQHGEEAMAKALTACKLYKAMAHEADQDDLEIDISEELRKYAKEFQNLALELLEHCYRIDDDYTQQLLTYELKNFSDQTCLSLGFAGNHREFIAHTCCQILLTDMWMGGLRMRKNTSLKVIVGIFLPLSILALEFKSKEELQLMPQTIEEHLDDLEEEGVAGHDSVSMSSYCVDHTEFGDDPDRPDEIHLNNGGVGERDVLSREETTPKSDIAGNTSTYPYRKRKSPLRLGKKIYEFYNAPITKFWLHTFAYISFLLAYTYIVLARTLPQPRIIEYYVMAYVATTAIEKIRVVIASEPVSIWKKLCVYFVEIWNIWNTVAIIMYFVAVSLRMVRETLQAGRVVYTIDIVFWYISILEILSVNKYLGPYVKIIGKLVVDMLYYIIILLIVLMSFGIVRQAIHFPNDEPSWSMVRNLFFYPYWMIYGELFADLIDPCDNPETCVYGSWVAPALMTLYLLVANIMMVNLLIARFNATFIHNNAMSREIWKFQRYTLIIEYEMKPILPPPLIFFNHIFLAAKYVCRRCKGKRDYFDNGLKLFLSDEDTEKLHDFEEECVEDFFGERENKKQSSSEERIRVTNERVENMGMQMEDMNSKETAIKSSIISVDYRLSKLEEVAIQTGETLSLIHRFMDNQFSRSQSAFSIAAEDLRTSVSLPDERHHMTDSDHDHDPVNSPKLVHSKSVKQSRLHMFTDYSKSQPPHRFTRSSSIKPDMEYVHTDTNTTSYINAELPSYGSDLQNRRGRNEKLALNLKRHKAITSDDDVASDILSDVDSNTNSNDTVIENPVSTNHKRDDSVYSFARIDSDTQLASRATNIDPTTGGNNNSTSANNSQPDSPHPTNYANLKDAPLPLPMAVVTPITPMLTPLTAEYTTITDDIDTSCMMIMSPNGSPPSSPNLFTSKMFKESQDGKLLKSRAHKNEDAILKKAEETECKKYEQIIRHRLRQISLDDTADMGNIARLVVDELKGNNLEEENTEYDADGEDYIGEEVIATPTHTYRCTVPIEIRVSRPSVDHGSDDIC